jgi:hypothetical protein
MHVIFLGHPYQIQISSTPRYTTPTQTLDVASGGHNQARLRCSRSLTSRMETDMLCTSLTISRAVGFIDSKD